MSQFGISFWCDKFIQEKVTPPEKNLAGTMATTEGSIHPFIPRPPIHLLSQPLQPPMVFKFAVAFSSRRHNQTRPLLSQRCQSPQKTLIGSALITQLSSIDWSFLRPICKVLRLLSHSCNCQQCWRVQALLPQCQVPGSVKQGSQSHRFAGVNKSKKHLGAGPRVNGENAGGQRISEFKRL